MNELTIERMEMVSGGCSFEELVLPSSVFFLGLGMYIQTGEAIGLITSGAATLAMFACM
jgi:hypothetical protein